MQVKGELNIQPFVCLMSFSSLLGKTLAVVGSLKPGVKLDKPPKHQLSSENSKSNRILIKVMGFDQVNHRLQKSVWMSNHQLVSADASRFLVRES